MAENSNSTDKKQATKQGISQARRRVLKAAAASAPVIATLPSGAAIANASASQCLISTREASNQLPDGDGGDWIDPAPDVWVRWAAQFITVGIPSKEKRQYYVLEIDGATRYYAADYAPGPDPDTWNDVPDAEPGSNLNRPDATDPPNPAGPVVPGFDFTDVDITWLSDPKWPQTGSVQRNVLVMFQESGTGPFPSNGVHITGIYPNAMRGTEAFQDNMGITESCLCSVDPQYRDAGLC